MSTRTGARRILVVGINYAPESISTGKYTAEMCAWLSGRGHSVRVVTAPPYYPAWKVWPDYPRVWFKRHQLNGVDVIRCPLWVPENPSGIKRLLHLASFALSSTFAVLASVAWRPSHVIVVAPTLANAPSAWLAGRLAGARCHLHIQDFELDAALDMGIIDAGPFKRLAATLERWLLQAFDSVSTISPKMVERLASKGVDEGRRLLFPNWADIDSIRPLTEPSPYRKELAIPENAVVALYSGNMGLKQGLELLGEAAERLRSRHDLFFVFGGQGPGRQHLEAQCGALPNVRFLDLQPSERLNEWLGLADIHLLPQRADVADLVMPSKLTGMLASGRPVLATALPGTGVALAIEDCGRAVPPGDVDAFVHELECLASHRQLREALGVAGRLRAQTSLAREAVLTRFEHSLQLT
jgi:Glycosyltransferase